MSYVISAVLLLASMAGVKRGKGIGIRARETAKGTREGEKGRFPISPSWCVRIPLLFPFLNACQAGYFISYPVPIKELLQKQEAKIFKKIISTDNHPLAPYIPSKKDCFYDLRKKKCARPKVNTERFMSTFVNR